ncbi:MAG: DUF4124 domain-containing protein [Pseudomonadales bacterium]
MNNGFLPIQALIFLFGLSASLTLQAVPQGHYRWIDESGTVQYSDRPPEGIKSEFIKFSSGGKSSKANSANTEEAKKEPKIHDEMEMLPPKDPKLCQQAQSNLQALQAARIRITEPDGSKRIITEEEKEDQRENARKFIKLHCE